VPTTDGALYFIRPDSQCVDRLDVGGRVYMHQKWRILGSQCLTTARTTVMPCRARNRYSRVLAEHVSGRHKMDLVMTTAEGEVICLATQVPYHPLRASYVFLIVLRCQSAVVLAKLVDIYCICTSFCAGRPRICRRCRTATATRASTSKT